MKAPDPQALAVWNQLVQSHEGFAIASTDFLTGSIDRVAVIRYALNGHGKSTAMYMLRSLKQSERMELFDDLIFHASYSHGGIGAIREAILTMPHDWVMARIEGTSEPILANATYDEYRRLLELYSLLDPALTRRLAERAIAQPDPDIKEAGYDFLT